MVIAVLAIVLVFVLVMFRSVFIQNEIFRPIEEGEGGRHLRRLRVWFYLFFWGGTLVTIAGPLAQINWLRVTGTWIWLASLPLFIARHLEFKRHFRRSRKHE